MVDIGDVAEVFYSQLNQLRKKRLEELMKNWELLFFYRSEKSRLEATKKNRPLSPQEREKLEELIEVLLPPLEMMFPGF